MGPEFTHPAQLLPVPWWRDAVIYQVYPRSFADSDGDGNGDLPGLISRLDHLVELGVDALWVCPFYPSADADGGYDVTDHRAVDPRFGTLDDVDRLIDSAHRRDLRVLIDLVPNHSSSEHPWFVEALDAGPGSAPRSRYLFRPGRGADGQDPPNNWRSVFGGPAWSPAWSPAGADDPRAGGPQEWYLHLFDSRQPDFNWNHPQVQAEFEDLLRFWLDRGVDGFRVDVAHSLVKQDGLPDWDSPAALLRPGDAGYLGRGKAPMWDQDAVHDIYRHWRTILDEYSTEDRPRILCAEAWVSPPSRAAAYVRPDEMHQSFNFALLQTPWRAAELRATIEDCLAGNDAVGAPTTWVLSNHDVVRHASRLGLPPQASRPNGIGPDDPQPDAALGLRRARAATALILALPGSAYLYQGEELGLPDHTRLPARYRTDPGWFRSAGAEPGRDGCRVPMPWSSQQVALGFSPTGASWLPQPEVYRELALDRQRAAEGSTWHLYRRMLQHRKQLRLGTGSLTWCSALLDGCSGWTEGVLGFHNDPADPRQRPRVTVLTNISPVSVPLPEGSAVLLVSSPLDAEGRLAPDSTAWLTTD